MARRRYLVAYDIASPVRLRRVCQVMESFGERLQYSVFLCDLSISELVALEGEILEIVRVMEDSVVRIDLGPMVASASIHVIGRPRVFPRAGPGIV